MLARRSVVCGTAGCLKLIMIMNCQSIEPKPMEAILAAVGQLVTLQQLIPICMHCKRVRIGDQSWHPVENHSIRDWKRDWKITHGLCPECFEEQISQIQAYSAGAVESRG